LSGFRFILPAFLLAVFEALAFKPLLARHRRFLIHQRLCISFMLGLDLFNEGFPNWVVLYQFQEVSVSTQRTSLLEAGLGRQAKATSQKIFGRASRGAVESIK